MDQEAFRRAFASGEFGQAQQLWGEYAEDLRQAIIHGTARARMLEEAAQLVEWARRSAKAYRAHSAARLDEARAAAAYAQPGAAPPGRIRALL
ncbi:MAG: hypothetical protein LAQ30_12630 [Acidobacteriia bacterium]|nr:hypothetical protein [Terriglobia bacterium]